jgi:hypothetical protein
LVQVLLHPLAVFVRLNVNDEPHVLPACTLTEVPVVDPMIEPLPEIDQL